MSDLILTARCQGHGCDWTVEYDLSDTASYFDVQEKILGHKAACQMFATSRAEYHRWTKEVVDGAINPTLAEYVHHREFARSVADLLGAGVLEYLLDVALERLLEKGISIE